VQLILRLNQNGEKKKPTGKLGKYRESTYQSATTRISIIVVADLAKRKKVGGALD